MSYTFNNIIVQLKESIDSDDVLRLASEIEMKLTKEEIEQLKLLLKDISVNKSKITVNTLYIKYLLNYLEDTYEQY